MPPSFTLLLPADAKWAHVGRTVALTAGASLDWSVARSEDAALVIGEALAEISQTAGVTELEVEGSAQAGRLALRIEGRGEDVDPPSQSEWGASVAAMVITRLAESSSVELASGRFSISAVISA